MKDLAEIIAVTTIMTAWICGIVLAKGFWSTLFAVFAPPWAWYLFAERGLQLAGWI